MGELKNLVCDVFNIKRNNDVITSNKNNKKTNTYKNKKDNINVFPLPIKKIGDIVQLEDNSFKIIAKVSPVNGDLMDYSTLEDISDCIQGAIVSYDGRLQILVQSEYVNIENNIFNIDKVQEKLSSELKIELLEEQKKFLHSMSKKTNNVLNFYIILESNEKDYFIAEQILEDYLQTIKTELENSDLFVERLLEKEIKEMLYEKLNPVSSQSELLQDYFEINNIMPEYTMIDKDGKHLEVENYVYRHFAISGYPLRVDKYRWLRKLFNFKGSFTVSFIMTPKDKSKIQNQLSKAIQEVSRKELENENKDEAKRQKFEQEAQSGRDMIRELGNDNTTLYDVNITIQVGATNREELERLVNSLRAKISSTYLQATELRNKEYLPFFNCLPILAKNKITQNYVWNLSSRDIASLILFDSSELMEEMGLLIGENTKSNGLVILDFYNRIYNNPHLAIVADSGSGKSFWIACNIIRDMPYMENIIQFDVDGTANFPWAEKYKFNGISGIKANPFHIRNSMLSKEGQEEESNVGVFLLVKVMNLITFFKWILTDMTPFDEALLEEDIRDTYEKFGLTFESKKLPKVFPIMSDLLEVMQEKIEKTDKSNSTKAIESRVNMKASLNPHTNGAYASIFNGQTNWEYTSHTILDVSELPKAVQKPLYELLLKDTWQFCKKDGTLDKMPVKILKKVIIDECHRFADKKNPQTLEFISDELLKQSRKFGVNVVTATQSLSDLISIGKEGENIIGNSYFKIFFRLIETDHNKAKELYKFSNEEMKIVNGSGSGTKGKGSKGRGIFMAGSQRVLFQSRASKYELEIIDPVQYEEIYKVKSRFRG